MKYNNVQSLVDDAVIIEFNTERDRMRGMAVLMSI
jgi:hypothetical protein